jgi:hypothetical protein
VAEEAEDSEEVRDPNSHPTHQPEERATNIHEVAAQDEVKAITLVSPKSRPMPPPIRITETITNSGLDLTLIRITTTKNT